MTSEQSFGYTDIAREVQNVVLKSVKLVDNFKFNQNQYPIAGLKLTLYGVTPIESVQKWETLQVCDINKTFIFLFFYWHHNPVWSCVMIFFQSVPSLHRCV